MFLDFFRPRLHNPKTGERWIKRPAPVDVFLGYALAVGAVLFFVLVTLSIVAHAHRREQAPAARAPLKPAPRRHPIHPPPQSLAEPNAEMFRGTQQALDQLGNFPAKPAKKKEKQNDAPR